jgi:hypothetical protein
MYDTGVGVTLGNGKSKGFINGALPIFQLSTYPILRRRGDSRRTQWVGAGPPKQSRKRDKCIKIEMF